MVNQQDQLQSSAASRSALHSTGKEFAALRRGCRPFMCCALLLITISGCGLMPGQYRQTKHKKQWNRPLYGVEDVVLHGHKRTWWRQWDEGAWRASSMHAHYLVPEAYSEFADVTAAPTQIQPDSEFAAPVEPVPEVP